MFQFATGPSSVKWIRTNGIIRFTEITVLNFFCISCVNEKIGPVNCSILMSWSYYIKQRQSCQGSQGCSIALVFVLISKK